MFDTSFANEEGTIITQSVPFYPLLVPHDIQLQQRFHD